MNIFAPDYFKKFHCTSDNCTHNCCIGWEIDIDDNTLDYYRSIKGDFGKRLEKSILTENCSSFFKLDHNDRCPFLNTNNLCDIILNFGEDALCQICTDHPRFRNYFDSHTEIGLGLTCEEASRLILTHTEITKIININTNESIDNIKSNDNFFSVRNNIFNILQNRNFSIDERIKFLVDTYHIQLPDKSFSEWVDFYLTLEQLDPDWQKRLITLKNTVLTRYDLFDDSSWQIAFEQLLVYFIYRHLADSIYDNSFNERFAFSIISFKLIHSLCTAHVALNRGITLDTLIEIARQYSSEIEYSEDNINCILDEILVNT